MRERVRDTGQELYSESLRVWIIKEQFLGVTTIKFQFQLWDPREDTHTHCPVIIKHFY